MSKPLPVSVPVCLSLSQSLSRFVSACPSLCPGLPQTLSLFRFLSWCLSASVSHPLIIIIYVHGRQRKRIAVCGQNLLLSPLTEKLYCEKKIDHLTSGAMCGSAKSSLFPPLSNGPRCAVAYRDTVPVPSLACAG